MMGFLDVFHQFIAWLVQVIGAMGYPGIGILMFLESSFFPFPSEVVMPPAGYLAAQGKMSLSAVLFWGVAGSLLGALFNYYICAKWGRRFFERWGKYFFVSEKVLDKAERFFADHGPISTLIGRLIPGVRQFISLPAGVARMPLVPFCLYTTLGAGVWVLILTYAGYVMGGSQEAVHGMVTRLTVIALGGCALLLGGYLWRHHKKKSRKRTAD